jgi:ABC-type sugar transport system ATPase subunit
LFGDFEESEDPYGEPEDPMSPVMSELGELKAWKEQVEQEQRVSEAMKVVDQQVSEAVAKHPDVPRELAEQFLASFAESDPQNAVSLSFEAAEKWMAQIQQGMVSDKLSQPEAAEQGQRVDGSPEQISTFAQASQAALQRLKNQ